MPAIPLSARAPSGQPDAVRASDTSCTRCSPAACSVSVLEIAAGRTGSASMSSQRRRWIFASRAVGSRSTALTRLAPVRAVPGSPTLGTMYTPLA